MKPKEWFVNKYPELGYVFDERDLGDGGYGKTIYLFRWKKKDLARKLTEYYLGRAKTLCRREGIEVSDLYSCEDDSRGQIDTWAAIVARVIADNGYQSMKQLNEEIDNLVRTDIRIWKTYIPQGGKEKKNG